MKINNDEMFIETLAFAEPMRLPDDDWFNDRVTLRRMNRRWKRERLGYSTKSKETK